MVTLSGPMELLFLLCFIATWTCVVVSVMLVVCSLSVFLSMCLFVVCVLCLTVLVNCLLNAFAICVGEVSVFSLKVMVFLGEEILPRLIRRTLTQLRTNKSLFLKLYLHKVHAKSHTSPLCTLCNTHTLKIQYAFIRQEHNIIYNHMNENNIRLETSTKEQKEPLS